MDQTGPKTPANGKNTAKFAGPIARLIVGYIRMVRSTSKIVSEPSDYTAKIWEGQPHIMACWHGQFLLAPLFKPKDMPTSAMVALHGDAEIIGRVNQHFGVELVRGGGAGYRKRDRGGAAALRAAVKALRSGSSLVMTADVPPGPARKAGEGIVTIARMSGRPVLPVAAATSRYKALSSWSRFTINLPFSKLAVVIGEPICVPRDADTQMLEQLRQKIEQEMNRVTARAYALAGAEDPVIATKTALPSKKRGIMLRAYQGLSWFGPWFAPALLRKRERRGKEDQARLAERKGVAGLPRPTGGLVWLHTASVGEMNAVLPLLGALHDRHENLHFLLTTGTVTSSKLAATRLPKRARHQFVPLDVPQYVTKFLDHWQPDLGVFVESEIWPNMLLGAAKRDIPMMLLNGRMSKTSFRRWRKFKGSARPLFSSFELVVAQNEGFAQRFRRLGARNAIAAGNLKLDAPAPSFEQAALDRLQQHTQGRPVFLAASTHPGEDEKVAKAHFLLKQSFPNLLTVLVPRHPERAGDIRQDIQSAFKAKLAQRSIGELPTEDTDFYLADTLGELGLFYQHADVAFIGGSLVRRGGQNPIEPIKARVPIVSGPHVFNFQDIYTALMAEDAVLVTSDVRPLERCVAALLSDEKLHQRQTDLADAVVSELGGALAITLEHIEQFLPTAATDINPTPPETTPAAQVAKSDELQRVW